MPARRIALLLAAALLAGCVADEGPPIGSPIARFTLPDRAGRPVMLPTPGRAVLINYWASWCEPCREEMPLLDAYARANAASGPQVVGIALDEADEVEAFLAQTPLPFPVLVEAPGRTDSSVALGDSRGLLPYSVLIGADGRLLARRVGPFRDQADLQAWAAAAR